MIKIDKNIEMPDEKKEGIRALAIMEEGDSFFVERIPMTVRLWIKILIDTAKNEISNKYNLKLTEAHRNYEYIAKAEEKGTRVWRVK